MIKKIVTTFLIIAMVCGVPLSVFAASENTTTSEQAVSPQAIASTYELENVRKVSSAVSYGSSWLTGPKATGSTGGSISQSVSHSFSVVTSANITVEAKKFKAQLGFGVTDTFNITSTCSANVGAGKTVQIYYRGLYDLYTADQVLYQVGPGVPYHEVSRKSVKIYKPVNMEFKW